RFALVAMARLSGSRLPIFAAKAGPRRNSRLSPSSCSRTSPRAQRRLSNRNGERPSGFRFKRCEENWRFSLSGSENARAIEVNRSEPDWRWRGGSDEPLRPNHSQINFFESADLVSLIEFLRYDC